MVVCIPSVGPTSITVNVCSAFKGQIEIQEDNKLNGYRHIMSQFPTWGNRCNYYQMLSSNCQNQSYVS